MAHINATQIRNFKGYHQHRECTEIGDKLTCRWVFYICGFSFCDNYAFVLKFDGSEELVSIDAEDRILINGRRYGRKHWNH
ncbi:hypothetical protein [Mucilaginibacter psychrotolerans]|uniref:Uncharacterized protein n=1 Tax=Mucilaginibacter psychrotolerans TaxID=1524096 RepID=A0A4Y8SB26_9SPHI|nr:hypothetical protein [Mucilaginibacter psychrotolerans]TFF36178.1 hypothetical protein E2R66_16685 [Mucilaginibacter psychrotolerans]